MFDPTTLTGIHTLLSLVAIAAGFIVLPGLLGGRATPFWTGLFLPTAIATDVTGFMFPFDRFIESHWTGIASLVVLAAVLAGRWVFGLGGAWRRIYAAGMVLTLYFLVFVGVAQLFRKVPALAQMAPTLAEPPFLVSQVVVLLLFIVLAVAAARGFRGARRR
ncbi:MAG: hypothetical protein IT561_14055 [Alphaproteobacteria bacterium]|nr:hypothetical protein [Alphaproteobacteria bacterium]